MGQALGTVAGLLPVVQSALERLVKIHVLQSRDREEAVLAAG